LTGGERAIKRQAAPFSRGPPKLHPKRPGCKCGPRQSRRGQHLPPESPQVDQVLEALLAPSFPDCGDILTATHFDLQFQTEIPRPSRAAAQHPMRLLPVLRPAPAGWAPRRAVRFRSAPGGEASVRFHGSARSTVRQSQRGGESQSLAVRRGRLAGHSVLFVSCRKYLSEQGFLKPSLGSVGWLPKHVAAPGVSRRPSGPFFQRTYTVYTEFA
jgi:hypothetical protein